MNKKIIRKEIAELRNSLKLEDKKDLDKKIFNFLIKSDFFQNAKRIFIYVSYKNEVDTRKIIEYSLKNEKIIYVPKINNLDNTMDAVKINSLDVMNVNKYGILEPDVVDKNDIGSEFDLIIMPGIAFDKEGNRIGYGGGYYDKYISKLNYNVLKIGLAYNFQITDIIKAEFHDIKVDYIITNKEIINR